MSNYLIFLLMLVMCLPSSFSYFFPLFFLGFIFQAIARPRSIACALNPVILIGFGIMLVSGSFLVLFNVIEFGDVSPATYWIAGILSWLIIVILIRSVPSPAEVINKSILYSGLVAGAACLLYVISFLSGAIPDPISFLGYQAYFGLDDRGFFAYSTTQLPLIPYVLTYLVVQRALQNNPFKLSEKIAIILLLVAGLLSLRSFVFITSIFVLLYYVQVRKKWFSLLIGAMILLLITLFAYYNSDAVFGVIDGVYRLKWEAKVSGEDIRYNQIMYWLESFSNSPFFGHGISSVKIEVYDMASGELAQSRYGPIDAPYGYEIFYAKTLSDIGLILFVYVLVFFYLSFFGRTTEKERVQLKALRASAIVMILQSATNSYLGTSGWLFVLMLPMLLLSKPVVAKRVSELAEVG